MTTYLFNRNQLQIKESGIPADYVTADLIEATPTLRRASLSNAALFGGPLIRRVLESAPIVGDRDFIVVDTKVTFLMPSWYPAIPGWHTDGVPRGYLADPTAPEARPMLRAGRVSSRAKRKPKLSPFAPCTCGDIKKEHAHGTGACRHIEVSIDHSRVGDGSATVTRRCNCERFEAAA